MGQGAYQLHHARARAHTHTHIYTYMHTYTTGVFWGWTFIVGSCSSLYACKISFRRAIGGAVSPARVWCMCLIRRLGLHAT